MVAGKPKMLEGSAIRTQLICRHRLRREALPAEQLAHELDGCAFVPSALNKDFENLAFMIDRAPQVHMLAGDPDDHLVEMPAIARPRTAPPQPACDNRPEFQHPATHRLVRDIEPALGEKLFHIAVAQGEPEVQPDGVLDDDRRKAMATVRDIGYARGYRWLRCPTSSLS